MGRSAHYGKRKKRRTKKNGFLRFLLFVFEIFLLILLAAGLFLSYKYARMTKVKVRKKDIQICQNLSDSALARMEGYRTLPVFLIDSQNERMEDIFLIASIEKENGNVRFTALDSGIWLTDGNGYSLECNEIYEVDGPKAVVSLLNQNLNLQMEDFLVFQTCFIEETVDRFGGIDVTLDEEEAEAINELLRISGKEMIPSSGEQHLNGEQAMVYWRNTISSESQMEKLAFISEKLLVTGEGLKLTSMNHVTDELLYHVSASLSFLRFCNMLEELKIYEIKPYGEMPKNITENPEILHKYLYAN